MSTKAPGDDLLRKQRIVKSRQHIPKDDLKKRAGAGGRSLTYAETWQIIDNLNTVFEHDWTHEVLRLEKNGSGWLCIVRVTVSGHGFHDGVGWGSGADEEKAVKEAESDALKRAAKNFGNFFGLSLYDKDHLNEIKM
jgi:DNA repair and recombination protein RAD52